MLLCGLPASDSFQSYHCRSHHVLADEPMATRSSTTTSALRLQQRRHGLVCPNCWTKHPSKQESLPFIAAFCAWIASQDIDNRSRGAAIDPESFRDSAYAPRHPIDLAQVIRLIRQDKTRPRSAPCSVRLLLTILGLPNGCRKRTWECVMCLETFSDPFPYIHPPLSTCGGAQRSSRLLKLEATFCLRFLQGGVETILTRK